MNNSRIKKITTISLLSALIVILQIIATYINFGSFPITLTLIPIIIGACIYGPLHGGLLGFIFGVIVSIMVIIGQDPSGAIMLSMHPVITISTCLLKGFLAGLFSGLVYKFLNIKNNKLRLLISAAVCPIINTLILCLSLIMFFDNNFTILIGTFVSINFVIELLINIILAPGLTILIDRFNKRYN